MGVRLIEDILDNAPAELTPAERVVLLVIAANANDTTRAGWPGMDLLAHRAGLAPDSVQKVLRRLASRGLEVRVPVGTDAKGRPVFACRGRQTTYRLPIFPPRERPDRRPPIDDGKGGPPSGLSEEKGRMVVRERADDGPRMGGPPSGPSRQEPSGNRQQREAKPSDEERAAVLAEIRRRKPDASGGLIRHIYRQDGRAILAEIRERAGRQRIADWIASLASQPPCIHGQPGGAQLRPDTYQPQCALCREALRRNSA